MLITIPGMINPLTNSTEIIASGSFLLGNTAVVQAQTSLDGAWP
jgi:hypothetical protein